MNDRERLKDKKRIVIKIGSSSLTHAETGKLNLRKLEILVRELGDLRNQGKDVVLVSSGAIAVGAAALGFKEKPQEPRQKQDTQLVIVAKSGELSQLNMGVELIILILRAIALAIDRKSTRLNSSHVKRSRMPSSA